MIILEIQKDLVIQFIENEIKSISKFYEVFENKIIAILYDSQMKKLNLNVIINEKTIVETYTLNNFAKSRLINNFESERPELTFLIMGCDKNSKLIKIWTQYVK